LKAYNSIKFFKLSNIFLTVGFFLSSCLGSKFLKDDEKMLVKQNVKGISGSLRDNSLLLLNNQTNTRLLFGLFPFTHLSHIYKLGENGISFGPNIARKEMRLSDKREIIRKRMEKAGTEKKRYQIEERAKQALITKQKRIDRKRDKPRLVIIPGYRKDKAIKRKAKIEQKLDKRIAKTDKTKKKNKLRAKKARKLDKKERKIKQGNQTMRWGEALSIYDHNESKISANAIQDFLYSKGFFNATVRIDTANYDRLHTIGKTGRKFRNWFSRMAGAKHRYINLDFVVDKKERYFIDSIQLDIRDETLQELILENKNKSPLKKGYYDQQVLSDERDYIYDLAVNNGYHEFSKQYISFQVDSTHLGRDSLIVREVILNPDNKSEHKIFYIDSIVFISDAGLSQAYRRTTETFRDITFSFGKKRYNKKILGWRIPIAQDDRYSKEITIETQRQLSFLDNFKFVNINYDTTGNRFVANVFTSPFERYETSSEIGFSSTTQGFPGPFVNINLKNRNAFNTLEIVGINLDVKLQDLRNVSNISSDDITGTYTSRQFGGELSVSFPKFLFPIGSYYQNKIGKYNPTTRVSFGVAFEDRISEYTRLVYEGILSYGWQVRDRMKYNITPMQISWINSNNSDSFQAFLNSLSSVGNSYANAFKSAVVGSSSFSREQNFGKYGTGNDGAFLKTTFEFGGHFNGLISNSFFGDELETFEYLKTNFDIRRINRLSRKYNLAYRMNVGYAYPFGDNRALPFDRYFFAGGSSSIRGWKPRRLGPGSYAVFEADELGNETNRVDFDIEQPGEILIESSIELRRSLVGFVEGALFMDAGNVWRTENNSNDPEFDRAVFKFDRFLGEIAVAAGVGTRFDLQFLILRLDLGFKIYDPAQKKGSRFVGDEIFSNFGYNSEFNIGIGYPF